MSKILLLCGKVGSGKTFYADALCSAAGFFKLSCDDLMLCLFDECPGPETHGKIEGRCKIYLGELAVRLLNSGWNVVLDYGFWTRAERDEARRFFSRAGHSVKLIYFDTPADKAAENLKKRNARLQETGERGYFIDKQKQIYFDRMFEPPAEDEDFIAAWTEDDPFLPCPHKRARQAFE